ncbi:CBS domain-containing protein [Candidatus Venteria ishoeyi]|uniref:Hypoxic response protein 1 n=1 Tax=Candidatus Venteria ishoeyi TaxID=1899563 RepID=A0A1H6F6K4_9GAMM|nr:CBS domain-containing protein [Candidatus Venteria ishoeyi]MDM8547330.1 CBS domain-containing protein [Candidatus Venteria ishoeyi]SEH05777.1 Hypoxic response protein 1 [Candidatus Venteria ishoeyi]SEH07395.1 Hypoxic response protein 1 [Candidatus Venteria ishoeyi]
MQVKDIMVRNVKTVQEDTGILEVSSMMCLYRINGLPVVGDDETLLGFIAEKDILHYLFPTMEEVMEGGGNIAGMDLDAMMGKYQDVVNLKVSDLMTRSVITVAPDMHILKATSIMVRHTFRRIPVAENGKLLGVISMGDVHKAIFQSNIVNITAK